MGLSAPACYVTGVVFAYGWFFLQWPFWSLAILLPLGGLLLWARRRFLSTAFKPYAAGLPSLKLLLFLLGLLSASLALSGQLQDRYTKTGNSDAITVVGRITGLPEDFGDYTRFRFRPAQDQPVRTALAPDLPSELLVNWYRDAPKLVPGQIWRLQLQIKPPWGRVNFQGMDKERWLFAEGLGGQATVKQADFLEESSWLESVHRVRQRLSEEIASVDSEAASIGMLRALGVGDRSGMNREQQNTLAITGTAHLLSISGLHIGLAYLFAFWLARLFVLPFSQYLRNSQVYCLLLGWLMAAVYTGLAGFSSAPIRSLVMLSVILGLVLARRITHPFHSLILALVAVMVIDPMTPLQAGAWMSFVAVAGLLFWFVPRRGNRHHAISRTLQAQVAVMCFCFPFSAWWFQLSSPSGLLANGVAIPWVSFVVVPMVLLSLVIWPMHDPTFSWLINAAGHASDWLMLLLQAMAIAVQDHSTVLQPSWPSLLLAMVAGGLILMPRGLRLQAPAALLILPLLLPAQPVAANRLQMDVLDVGQGTALLLQTGSKLLLYDSGPGDGEGGDLFSSVIYPAILTSGFAQPDRIIISHADLDHAGGLASLQDRFPDVPLYASLPQKVSNILPCDDGLAWSWQNSRFKVLHPSPYLPYKGNDSSCVLDIDAGQFRLLLSGDISTQVERRLLNRGLGVYRILLVPHHGSRSSSAPELLNTTIPELAIATAGIGNRFGFPRPEVRQRYADAGIRLISTDQCGAIRMEAEQDGALQLRSARLERKAPWRWPAGPDCP